MMFELVAAALPDGEAIVPLAECKDHLRIIGTDEDVLIAALRGAAIDFVQQYSKVRLSPQAMVWRGRFNAGGIEMGTAPVTAIASIRYRDNAGSEVTLDPSEYTIGMHGRVIPATNRKWPGAVSEIENAVTIEFTAGFSSGGVPPTLIAAVKIMLSHLYRNRGDMPTKGTTGEVPPAVLSLCDLTRVPGI